MPAAKPRAYFVFRRRVRRQYPARGAPVSLRRLNAKEEETNMIILIAILAAVSLAAFIVYGADKSRAKRGAWRISEKALLCLSFFGGAAGGLLGMVLFRHKTRHWYFWAVNFLGLVWQIAALVLLALYA